MDRPGKQPRALLVETEILAARFSLSGLGRVPSPRLWPAFRTTGGGRPRTPWEPGRCQPLPACRGFELSSGPPSPWPRPPWSPTGRWGALCFLSSSWPNPSGLPPAFLSVATWPPGPQPGFDVSCSAAELYVEPTELHSSLKVSDPLVEVNVQRRAEGVELQAADRGCLLGIRSEAEYFLIKIRTPV